MHKVYIVFIVLVALLSCEQKENPKTSKEIETVEPRVDLPIDFSISKDYVLGKFDPASHDSFTLVATEYAEESGYYLHKQTYHSFVKLYHHARADGIGLVIRSATRNFERQKQIWEAKWTGKRLVDNSENLARTTPDHVERAKKILRWSSMPGTSRHHWGTDIDLNAFTNEYFEKDEGLRVYEWLTENAAEYGFCQTYTAKGKRRPTGYNEEKWHWSYRPIADQCMRVVRDSIQNTDIVGFLGYETAVEVDMKQNYMLGVSSACDPQRDGDN